MYPALIPRFFFTCEPGNEERRLILGALIQNLKNKATVRNSLWCAGREGRRDRIDSAVGKQGKRRTNARAPPEHAMTMTPTLVTLATGGKVADEPGWFRKTQRYNTSI